MDIPITLTMAASAGLITFWLAAWTDIVRIREKVNVGDGGNDNLLRRMRAQANFIEYTPFVLFLIAALELAGHGSTLLWSLGGIYMAGRVAHGIGMSGGKVEIGRVVGTIVTFLVLLALTVYAGAVVMGFTPH
ncbi:MAPEG family protein [Alterisphingorhabdus coralli]|uniref:MAPEG family protein n=1 Tax=Alterisphingorhabdus coralli TaxID=3071408 RepID=A0AA97F920_9SPHN|nr:MAPEG family protein [Parasphingorhabdus sp. SCSIO 66989]WOE74710.1 MAPEG family protein [Parasphingorhabdus sp. SCSIO 66989]